MNFRTEIEESRSNFSINHDDRIVMLGSCFTDSVGELLHRDGFSVVHNPMGPLYNPMSLANIFLREGRPYDASEMYEYTDGFHCLDFASRYSSDNRTTLQMNVNMDFLSLAKAIEGATTIIVTFGSAMVYELLPDNVIVGNCHRLPATKFEHRMLTVDEVVDKWINLLPKDKKVIFTLSPIRYTADGLANNSLSKSTLRVAIDRICRANGFDYFPAFEILNDDLRDYRFYGDDMKHPTDKAVEYVYEHFQKTYFDSYTIGVARVNRKEWQRSLHNPNYRDRK